MIWHGESRDESSVRSMMRAGGSAYVLKGGPSDELLAAVRHIESGERYVTPLVGFGMDSADSGLPDLRSALSEREYQIFVALGSGARARDVALSLGLSAKTVDTYRASILRKLELDGLASLVRLAAAIERMSF